MNPRFPYRSTLIAGALTASAALLVTIAGAQAPRSSAAPAVPQASTQSSPFGGTVVEDVVAQVNDQIISRADYERAEQELEQRAKQQNMTLQQVDAEKRDLLRDLVDQQLLLSKGKELDITGETELVRELNDIRKQNHLDTMEDLQKAAESQGVNYEDYKASIRNRIITQQVIRDEVGRHLNITQADVKQYYEQHKDEFNKPESVRLSEILIPAAATADPASDPAKAQADDIYAKLKAGGDFDQLAKEVTTNSTTPQGGDLGVFHRGQLAKVLEDKTFVLKAGEYTAPIRTKQGYIILKVAEHTAGGQTTLKDVEPQVEDALAQERVQPAVRAYLAQARREAYIDYKPGYIDSAAEVNPGKPVYSAYTPPAVKKKKKAVRTRFRQKRGGHAADTQTASIPATSPAAAPAGVPSLADAPQANAAAPSQSDATEVASATTPAPLTASSSGTTSASPTTPTTNPVGDVSTTPSAKSGKTRESSRKKSTDAATAATMKPGNKEKIRFGQAPRETLPTNDNTRKIDAHATPDSSSVPAPAAETEMASNNADVPPETPEAPKVDKKRFSDRAKLPKVKKSRGPHVDPFAPTPPTAEEIAAQQTQAAPLGLAGDTAKPVKKKKIKPTEKTRLQDEKKPADATPAHGTAAEPAAPATTGTALQSPDQKPSAAPARAPTAAPAAPLETNPIQTPPNNTQGVPTPGDGNPSTAPPPPPQ